MRRNRDTAMTPGARIAAAIEVLDAIAEGAPAEKTLTTWARRNRFAGSGDRAAIRDHVFDALRCWRSAAWLGGAETGRGRMIGVLRDAGADPEDVFTGQGHAPPPLSAAELETRPLAAAPLGVRLDLPDWLLGSMTADLGDDLPAVAASLRRRAPLFLRANAARTSREAAQRALAEDGIGTRVNDLSPWALEVTSDPRRVQRARAYSDGLVEVQDAASQAVCAALPAGGRVLDFCAGGGGKSLALAALGARVTAHDSDPRRMRDLPVRAARAGVEIGLAGTADLPRLPRFGLVLCDAPCSGSGAWRRSPDAKWKFTRERLEKLTEIQDDILDAAVRFLAPGGVLAYATCSLLTIENAARADGFSARHPGWTRVGGCQLTPLDGGDGFFWALFRAP